MKLSKKHFLIGLVVLVIIAIGYTLRGSPLLDFDYMQNLIESTGVWAPLVFALLYIAITLTGISAAFFTLLAGALFGTINAMIIVVISATIAAVIAFYIARFFKHKFVGGKATSKHKGVISGMIKKIEDNAEDKGFITIAILRLSFLPYIPLSYAAGLVNNLKVRDFALATFITNIFGSFVFIYLGDRIGELLKGNFDSNTIVTLIVAIVLLVVFIVFVPKLTKKFSESKKK